MSNSWQPYVDNNLVGSGFISEAAIYGLDGGLWAKSKSYKQDDDLFKAVKEGFAKEDEIRSNGLRIAGAKYFTLAASPEELHFKCGAKGMFCAKTKQTIILALYPDTVQPGNASKALGSVTDYLKSLGF
ncbi:profilin, required for normal timing of actin polymerization in response to thermal stress [Coemansia sp. RSA 1836]|nr:profilin, required for normal timing of actin polymerization in response to thermal stress [Coemansia sp. RSA 1836]